MDAAVAAERAGQAASAFAAHTDEQRAAMLEAVADALDAGPAELLPTAIEETHIARPGSRARSRGPPDSSACSPPSLRDGAYLEAMIDHAESGCDPAATRSSPAPGAGRTRCRLRGQQLPLRVQRRRRRHRIRARDRMPGRREGALGASRALAPDGGDRRSRAAGAGAPDGAFGIVFGQQAGIELVQHPQIAAAAFTGSLGGGRALHRPRCGTPCSDPVLRRARQHQPGRDHSGRRRSLTGRTRRRARRLVHPGLRPALHEAGRRARAAGRGLRGSRRRRDRRRRGRAAAQRPHLRRLRGRARRPCRQPGRRAVVTGTLDQAGGTATPVVLVTTAAAVAADPEALLAETFGPVTLLVTYDGDAERDAVLAAVEGSLTGTIHAGARRGCGRAGRGAGRSRRPDRVRRLADRRRGRLVAAPRRAVAGDHLVPHLGRRDGRRGGSSDRSPIQSARMRCFRRRCRSPTRSASRAGSTACSSSRRGADRAHRPIPDPEGDVRIGARDGTTECIRSAVGSVHRLLGLPLAGIRRLAEPDARRSAVEGLTLLPPVDGPTDVWASGVTYLRSMDARVEESQQKDIYTRVYGAERPELFFKSASWRVVGDGGPVSIREDSGIQRPGARARHRAQRARRAGRLRRLQRHELAHDRGGEPALPAAGEDVRRGVRDVVGHPTGVGDRWHCARHRA